VLIAGIVVFRLFVNEHAVGAGVVPWRFSAEPIGFLVQLACLGYIAVSRFSSQDRRLAAIDYEMRSALEIQTSLLPRALPEVAGVRVAARYLPRATVAGDFYDVVALDMVRIRKRTSAGTAGLPVRPRLFQVHRTRKPCRCHAMTVSGLTMTSAVRHSSTNVRATPRGTDPPTRFVIASAATVRVSAVGGTERAPQGEGRRATVRIPEASAAVK
jgi:hypothetical protein